MGGKDVGDGESGGDKEGGGGMFGKIGVFAGQIGMRTRNLVASSFGLSDRKKDEVIEKSSRTVKNTTYSAFDSIGSIGNLGDKSGDESMYKVSLPVIVKTTIKLLYSTHLSLIVLCRRRRSVG